MRYHVVTLGCAKNTVDSMRLDQALRHRRHHAVSDPTDAELVLVNTCGFIDAAKEESLSVIRELDGARPERQRLVALKYARGMSNAEIGRMMGRSEGAVKALHHRTLRQLQSELARLSGEPEAGPAPRRAAGTGRRL